MTAFASSQVTLDRDLNYQHYYKRCKRLLAQFQQCVAQSHPITLKKKHSNLFRHRNQQSIQLDMSDFNHVLSIDEATGLIEVEALITYDALVNASLTQRLLPPVVPELKSITVGGALSGIGIESSSFRYGLVHETIVEFDVLTGDGEIVTCRADNEYSDLFFAFPNSYGSLGYALRVVLKSLPATSFVELTHQHFHQPQSFFEQLEKVCIENQAKDSKDVHFVEGVVFSRHDLVLSTGQLVEYAPYVHNYKYMHIYYHSLQNRQKDYLPTSDYIWRWDTDWFWCSKIFGMQNLLVRFLVGKFCLKSTFYRKVMHIMHHVKLLHWVTQKYCEPTESVIQDVVIPIEHAYEFFQFFIETIPLRPFWICPTMRSGDELFTLFPLTPGKLYINFGFWGTVPTTKECGYYNRLIEQKVIELGGLKSLYSSAYYSEDEFWQIFDEPTYLAIKQKYDKASRLTSLYKKIMRG